MITIYDYIAFQNPRGAARAVHDMGMNPQRHPKALAGQLANGVRQLGDDGIDLLAALHPDQELFETDQSNCDCKKEESNFSSADGQAIKDEITNLRTSQNGGNTTTSRDFMIIGSIVLLGLAIVFKK